MPELPARILSRYLAAAVAAAIVSLISTANAQVVASVDGQPITELDIQQRMRFHELATRKTPNRQDVIDELSKEIHEISQAQRHSIAPSDAEMSKQFEGVASRMGVDSQKLTEILTKAGASAATFEQELRADIARTRLERGGYDPHGN